jgi:hypothetical protein
MAQRGLHIDHFITAPAPQHSILMQSPLLTVVAVYQFEQTVENVTSDIADLILSNIASSGERGFGPGSTPLRVPASPEVVVILPATRDKINRAEIEHDAFVQALETPFYG